jgi:hypothetical protein
MHKNYNTELKLQIFTSRNGQNCTKTVITTSTPERHKGIIHFLQAQLGSIVNTINKALTLTRETNQPVRAFRGQRVVF